MSPEKKQRPIIRLLSTKFAPRPPPGPSAYDKDSRNAALKARGLLPAQSPADLVKNEWVAKNNDDERQRMHAFKFGRPPTPPLLEQAGLFPPPPTALPPLPPKHQLPTPPRSPHTPPSPLLTAAFHLRDDSFAQLEHSVSSPPQVKSTDAPSVPVIVESPIEHRFSQDLHVVQEDEDSALRVPMTAPATVTITPAPILTQSPTLITPVDHQPPAVPSARRKRGMTDSTAGARKSLNPFRRDKPDQEKSVPKTEPTLRPRRLSMSASLNNLRRSFIGSLSRPSPATSESSAKKSFNASHLPPSPTIPAAFAVQASNSLGSRLHAGSPSPECDRDALISPSPTARIPRQPQPVVMYNRGSILLETANIEDDEVRRMTELAFLG